MSATSTLTSVSAFHVCGQSHHIVQVKTAFTYTFRDAFVN